MKKFHVIAQLKIPKDLNVVKAFPFQAVNFSVKEEICKEMY